VGGSVKGFWLARPALANLVDNLPPSCTSLEIGSKESHHHADADLGNQVSGHLCSFIRRVMPQLQYLRLCLRSVCPEMCGVGFELDHLDDVAKGFKPIEAPRLKQFILNLRSWPVEGPVCNATKAVSDLHHPSESFPSARKTVTKYLRHAFECSCFPFIEKLWVIDEHWKGYQMRYQDSYAAYFWRNVVLNLTEVFPYKSSIGWPRDKGSIIRMPHDDYVNPPWVNEVLVEGECWQESVSRECAYITWRPACTFLKHSRKRLMRNGVNAPT